MSPRLATLRFGPHEAQAAVEDAPFSHLLVTTFFPTEIYDQVLTSLPPDSFYQDFFHDDLKVYGNRSSRRRLSLSETAEGRHVATRWPIWHEVNDWLTGDEFRKSLCDALQQGVGMRFAGAALPDVYRPSVYLFRDTGGYRIKPHPDRIEKAITFQVYLTSSIIDQGWGTILYERADGNQFQVAKQIPFRRNTAYAFAVHNESWHGVEELPAGAVRDSLMVIYVRQ